MWTLCPDHDAEQCHECHYMYDICDCPTGEYVSRYECQLCVERWMEEE